MNRSLLVRAGAVGALATAAVLTFAGPAAAHVTVNPNTATQGGYTKVTFRVPNESDTTSTTKLEVNLPADAPVASVSLKPLPGWTAVAVKSKLATPIKAHDTEITEAVSKITWTATAGSEIKPGNFQEFDVSLGPLPTNTNQIIFKALQTYSDNKIVRWIDEPATGGAEPEHPAPVLKLTAATGDAHGTSAAPSTTTATKAAADGGDDGGSGRWLGVAGLVAGIAGLIVGLLAYRRSAG